MKNIVAYVTIVLSILIILFGVLEITLRVFVHIPSYPAIPIEFSQLTGRYVDGVWITDDFKSDFLNYKNGMRVIPNAPLFYDSKILIFGNSTMEGLYVDDSHTSSAFLQGILNVKGYHTRVENWADSGAYLSTEFNRLKYVNPKAGNIVVFVDGALEESESLNCQNSYQGTYFVTYYALCSDLNYLPHWNDNRVSDSFKQELGRVETYCKQHGLVFIHILQPRQKLISFYIHLNEKLTLFPANDFSDDRHFSAEGERDFSEFLYQQITQSVEF